MAISLKPRLLLLDEPTAGMSPEETHLTGEMVQRLNAEGMTVLAIEHDMAFVRQVAQRVTVLHLGQVFAQGSIERDHRRRARRGDLSGAGPCVKEADPRDAGLARRLRRQAGAAGPRDRGAGRRDRRRDRPQRRRQVDADEEPDRSGAGDERFDRLSRRGGRAVCRRTSGRASAWATCRRGATCFRA